MTKLVKVSVSGAAADQLRQLGLDLDQPYARIVARALAQYAVHHLDGDRTNNDLANLSLVPIGENRRRHRKRRR